jgi:restriction system protein
VASAARPNLPSYRELIYPVLRVVASLGGSAQGSQIVETLIESLKVTPEQLAVTYEGRPKSVLINRMEWARSYAKLGGALDSPRRGLFVLSGFGKHILSLPEGEGRALVNKLDRDVRTGQRRRAPAAGREGPVEPDEYEKDVEAPTADSDAEDDDAWKEPLLARLHRLSPAGFEKFTF